MSDRPRFSVRMLLGFTAAVAAGCALYSAPREYNPDWRVGVLAFIAMAAVPASAIVGIIYAGRYGRAFSVGVLTASSWMVVLLWAVMHDAESVFPGKGMAFASGSDFFRIFARNACHDIGAITLCSLAVGFICVIACWCVGPPKD